MPLVTMYLDKPTVSYGQVRGLPWEIPSDLVITGSRHEIFLLPSTSHTQGFDLEVGDELVSSCTSEDLSTHRGLKLTSRTGSSIELGRLRMYAGGKDASAHGPSDAFQLGGPWHGIGASDRRTRMELWAILYIPSSLVASPVKPHPPLDIRVKISCRYITKRSGVVMSDWWMSGEATGRLDGTVSVAINAPAAVGFGSVPAGGGAVQELHVARQADGPWRGTMRYYADNPDGTDAKIGDGKVRVWLDGSGYVDLTGKTGVDMGGTGILSDHLKHKVYLDVPSDSTLGSFRTNLRLSLTYN